ncbi:hypothetical protein [Synechococcus sp. MIT S9508]|uniref:hypothetical protein n=1 Tax=Synechococcus sp. MIT S9508 TaxID=1801629 RepID=UPI0007BB2BCC|nr:hypothetical protein [Synechococcus sp. MIT S9508]KZR90184.1 hypothetical protein MITS9508_00732 [Synechococcus sp. MIT S9508]
MDGDFQSNYLAAEEAYGTGDFETAQSITVELLNQLEPIPDEGAERDAVLAWRAFVALLAGHIDLYGFQAPDQAERHYQLVLASHPQDTLRELAEQGLERIRSGRESVTRSTQATDPTEDRFMASLAIKGSLALVADPFINEASPAVDSVEPSVVTTAMPWLNNDKQSDDGHDQTLSIEINAVAAPEPETEPQPISEQEPEPGSEPEPGGELGQETTTEALTQATKTKADPEISDTTRKRLREGRIVVKLPARAQKPSENNSDSSQAPSRWSWLQKALRRS